MTAAVLTVRAMPGGLIQMIKFRGVIVQDVVLLVFGEILRVLFQDLLRPRPGRIAMREIVGPHQAPDVAHVLHLERDPVILKRGVHILAKVLARHLRQRGAGHPMAMAIVGVIHPVHVVRHPARIGFDAHHLEFRMTLEHAAEDEGADDVLASADDAEEVVQARSARREAVSLAGQDVKAERDLERGPQVRTLEGRIGRV